MNLVLLPGLDGSGELFFPEFLDSFSNYKIQVIHYPNELTHYDELFDFVKSKIEFKTFHLIAESFSGPIAAKLLDSQLKVESLTLVASFFSPPTSPWLIRLGKTLSRFPLPNFVVNNFLCNGSKANQIKTAELIKEVPHRCLAGRLESILKLKLERNQNSKVPILYLQAKRDFLVQASAMDAIKVSFPQLQICSLDSLHFVLQSKAGEAAKEIANFHKRL